MKTASQAFRQISEEISNVQEIDITPYEQPEIDGPKFFLQANDVPFERATDVIEVKKFDKGVSLVISTHIYLAR